MAVIRRRLLGVAFFLVLALFLTLTIMKFNKVFTDFVDVEFVTTSAGNSLPANADVKARGLIVGEVRSVTPNQDSGQVTVKLGIYRDKVSMLPENVTGRILPKTLFGERYIALQIPEQRSTSELTNGDVIQTDSSKNAIEIQQLFDSLLPVLQNVPPKDLNTTLGALSTALAGNGEKLGATIEDLNTVFTRVNANMPELQGTLRGLTSFSQTYSKALPDIVDALDTLRTTNTTILQKQQDLRNTIAAVTKVAEQGTGFLNDNRRNLVDLAVYSEPLLRALARHSGAFACTFRQFAEIARDSDNVVGYKTKNPGVRVSLQFVNPRGRYLPNQDEPRFFDKRDPACIYPTFNGRPFGQYPGGAPNAGAYNPPSRNPDNAVVKPVQIPDLSVPSVASTRSQGSGGASSMRDSYSNEAVRRQMQIIIGSATGQDPSSVPSWATLPLAPALQGKEVTIR